VIVINIYIALHLVN